MVISVSYIKMIFITASPLLARNVSRMYHRVLNYLKTILKEKEVDNGLTHRRSRKCRRRKTFQN